MRTIKFRAQSVHNGEWVYGNFIHSKRFAGCGNEFRIHEPETGLESDVIPETLGQLTGLTDKNGVEIYEGDVVESDGSVVFSNPRSDRGARREIFRMQSGFTGVRVGNEFDKANFSSADNWGNYQLYNSRRSLSVIGNVHNNPELQ